MFDKNLKIKVIEYISVLLLLFSLSYLSFGVNILNKEIVAPMDLLLQYPGYKESGFYLTLNNPERSDIVDSFFPSVMFVKREISVHGVYPLWNYLRNYGNPVSFDLSTLIVLFFDFITNNIGIAFTLFLFLKLTIAGFGTYLMCRENLGFIPSLFASVTFMFCGFMCSWLMWSQTTVAMFIPYVVYLTRRLFETLDIKYTFFLALVIALTIMGNFPFI
ncbi:MAG: hypothetical protein QW472_04805, partial [Candidatus Aenigmatarchaeota archaeon]